MPRLLRLAGASSLLLLLRLAGASSRPVPQHALDATWLLQSYLRVQQPDAELAGCWPSCKSTDKMLAAKHPATSASTGARTAMKSTTTGEEDATAPALPTPPPWMLGRHEVGGQIQDAPTVSTRKLERLMAISGSALPGEPMPWFYSSAVDKLQGSRSAWGFDTALRTSGYEGSLYKKHLERLVGENLGGWARSIPAWKGLSYFVRGNCHDQETLGDVFTVHDKDPLDGSFSLLTIHGTFLYLEANGQVTANRSLEEYEAGKSELFRELTRLQEGKNWEKMRHFYSLDLPLFGFRFKFVDHPYGPRGKTNADEHCWVPASRDTTTPERRRRAAETCIGVKDSKEGRLVLMGTANETRCQTLFGVEAVQAEMVQLRSCYGTVTADLGPEPLLGWLDELRDAHPWEMRITEDPQSFVQRWDFRNDFPIGWVTGLVVSVLLALALHSAWFAITDDSPPAKARLPEFDVARSILEIMVIYEHTGIMAMSVHSEHWMSAYRMPGFVFIAGVFGSSMEWRSVSNMWCYTLGTTVLLIIIRIVEVEVIHGESQRSPMLGEEHSINDLAGVWFLACLFVWRTVVTPLFHLSRHMGLRPGAFLAGLWFVCWFLMHWTRDFHAWIYGLYNWGHTIFFASFFAAGLLLMPVEWDSLFRKRWFQACSLAYFVIWHLLTLFPAVLEFNRSYCLYIFDKDSCLNHHYNSIFMGPVNIGSFFYDLILYLLRLGITLSFIGLVYPFSELLAHYWPQLRELLAGWGSRTLYAYILHLHFTRLLVVDGLVAHYETVRWCRQVKLLLPIPLAIVLNAAFASKGTERLFKWLLMPLWLKTWFGGLCFQEEILEQEWTWWTSGKSKLHPLVQAAVPLPSAPPPLSGSPPPPTAAAAASSGALTVEEPPQLGEGRPGTAGTGPERGDGHRAA